MRRPAWLALLQQAPPALRLLYAIPATLRRPLTQEEARAVVRTRLERRGLDFLNLARTAIYDYPESPYRELLGAAGCEYGDLERLVEQDGVEGALTALFRKGVYLTVEESKGRRPVVRGSAAFHVRPSKLANPSLGVVVQLRSSGSRGGGTAVPLDLAATRERGVNKLLAFASRGGLEWDCGFWHVPGGTGTGLLLMYGMFGAHVSRAFSLVDAAAPGLAPEYRWATRLARLASWLGGAPFPPQEYVPIEDPLLIARWMEGALRSGRIPHLSTFVSPAVRLCQAATAAGIELAGAQFTLSGEPATAARLGIVRATGAQAIPNYSSSESGNVGDGCLRPDVADDIHFYEDLHAVIQPGPMAPSTALPADALLLTSLRPTAKFVLLNTAAGDQASIALRDCGCPMEGLGWTRHLFNIRSYEKLTAGGMTFLDCDIARVLEEDLPRRFGGGPTHYQLVEDSGPDGRPRLRLLVHPSVGSVDHDALAHALLAAIGEGSGAERIMGEVWRGAGLVEVERRAPLTSSGKVLHLHLAPTPAREDAAPAPA